MTPSKRDLGAPPSSPGKKRAAPGNDWPLLELSDRSFVDVSKPIGRVDAVVVESLRRHLVELHGAKKARVVSASAPAVASGSASNGKSDAKLRDAKRKGLTDRLKKEVKGEKHKWRDDEAQVVKVEDTMAWEDYEGIFGDLGHLLQPLPDNKPTSKVYIRRLSAEDLLSALGDKKGGGVDLKGYEWSRSRGFPRPQPARKMGLVDLSMLYAEVEFSKPSSKLTLKIRIVAKDLAYNTFMYF